MRNLCMMSPFIFVMNMNVLPAPLDRGRQTCRSVIVQTVQGMIPLAVVRPAPLFSFLHSDRTICSMGGDA